MRTRDRLSNGGIHYYNVKSLGKDSGSYYSIVAVDSNGLSSVTPASNTWPVVLITAPVDRDIGGAVNPYAYAVQARSDDFVRALVFDSSTSTQVTYRVDSGAVWYPMSRDAAGSPIWQGAWDASALVPGEHVIQVRAVSTSTVYDSVTVQVHARGEQGARCCRRHVRRGRGHGPHGGCPRRAAKRYGRGR